jgi:hypothetical protein
MRDILRPAFLLVVMLSTPICGAQESRLQAGNFAARLATVKFVRLLSPTGLAGFDVLVISEEDYRFARSGKPSAEDAYDRLATISEELQQLGRIKTDKVKRLIAERAKLSLIGATIYEIVAVYEDYVELRDSSDEEAIVIVPLRNIARLRATKNAFNNDVGPTR